MTLLGVIGGILYGFGVLIRYGTHALGGSTSMWAVTETPGNIQMALVFMFCALFGALVVIWILQLLEQVGKWTLQRFNVDSRS